MLSKPSMANEAHMNILHCVLVKLVNGYLTFNLPDSTVN